MKLKHFAAASLVLAAGAFAAPAMAAVKVYDLTSVPSGSLTNILTTLDIHQFDTTLGTLTGITIEYGSGVSTTARVSNAGGKDKTTKVGLTSTMTLTGPGALSLGSDTETLISPVSVTAAKNTGSGVDVAWGSANLHSSYSVSAANFALFEGTGNVAANLAIKAVGTSVGASGILTKFTTLADGMGKVTYTYTIAPVPEPETYGMLLLGLGVVAFAAKRKSRSAQA